LEDNDNHDHGPPASLKNLIFAMVINGGIVVFDMIFGLLIQSMALISDAVHNLSDIAAIGSSYWAEQVARCPANEKKTYGYRKIEFITAFVNSIVLSVVIAFVFWESLQRLIAPPEMPGQMMLWVTVVAFVGNGAATLLLQKISARNFNMKKRLVAFSSGCLVFPRRHCRRPADHILRLASCRPLISMAICIFIARQIYKIVRQTVNALMPSCQTSTTGKSGMICCRSLS
jgi:cobalt-zinc-cadmium efflux system protein